ncbi:hypothetical protein BSK59_12905 [Paenibacillus odorifer]|uniref:distal tail protein Dit n=1 Tax=Paenibacillus odorifer TaxID=189426 RepID=UPI00096F5079|nr:distal tail protein Dit [Paenibacillus odorifer]OME55373.1 hypothetical protein BSK59_12905 [Paenibacillus odorifer]
MTIRDSLYFEFNYRKSKELKTINVNLDSGMQEEYFASSQSINEEKVLGKNKPIFQSVSKEPLKLTVTFAYEEQWDEDTLRDLRRWLTEPTSYAPLIFSNNPEKIYYAMYVDDPNLHHSFSQGYITLTFRCNDSYGFTPLRSKTYDWKQNKYELSINNFSEGEMKSIIIDSDGGLILNPHKTKWSDFPPQTKWHELGN